MCPEPETKTVVYEYTDHKRGIYITRIEEQGYDPCYAMSYERTWINALFDTFATAFKAGNYLCGAQLDDLWKTLNPVLPSDNIHYITTEDLKTLDK